MNTTMALDSIDVRLFDVIYIHMISACSSCEHTWQGVKMFKIINRNICISLSCEPIPTYFDVKMFKVINRNIFTLLPCEPIPTFFDFKRFKVINLNILKLLPCLLCLAGH